MAAIVHGPREHQEGSKAWNLCPMPWWSNINDNSKSNGRSEDRNPNNSQQNDQRPPNTKQQSFAAMAKASLLAKKRLRFDPDGKLYFMYEPGKQVSSAVRIKNVSKSYVAFKFQTNAPKSCFMRPPNGILPPKQSILATVMKFVEQPEHPQEKKTKDKFKIVSLKVKEGTEYTPELFEEHKDLVSVEKVLQVVFLDPKRQCQELDKLQKRLAEAEALNQARKKPQDDNTPKPPPAEGVIDEWKERREKYLARQQVEVVDSV
uniref:TSA: Wollemia nobilis Ref_Wollemi_Transcript_28578_1456 transcribed RNA sequence n=1 Tax=Wollemia nobilis TaxID=56998 RepID=A0A0C9RPQ8_9CONI